MGPKGENKIWQPKKKWSGCSPTNRGNREKKTDTLGGLTSGSARDNGKTGKTSGKCQTISM